MEEQRYSKQLQFGTQATYDQRKTYNPKQRTSRYYFKRYSQNCFSQNAIQYQNFSQDEEGIYFQPTETNTHSHSMNFENSRQLSSQSLGEFLLNKQYDYDTALDKVGSENWYQIRSFIIFALQWFVSASVQLCGAFLFPNPEYVNCPGGLTGEKCESYVCNQVPEDQQYKYLEYPTASGVLSSGEHLKLYCGKQTLNSIIQGAPYAGSLIGFLIFPMIADNYGRNIGWISSWGVSTIGAILMACSFEYYSMLIGFFLCGCGSLPAVTLHLSYLNEHSLGKFREYATVGVQVALGFGQFLMVIESFFIHNWRTLCIVMLAVPSVILNIGPIFVWESPKYLYGKSKEKAVKQLNKIAKINKKPPIPDDSLREQVQIQAEKTYTIIDLFRYKSLALMSYCACFCFFSMEAMYYGISLSVDQVGIDLYWNTFIIGIAELLAYLIINFLIPSIKRKKALIIIISISSVLSMGYLFLKGESDAVKSIEIIMAAVMRFCVCFAQTVFYVFLSESYPTVVSSLALGFTSLAGYFGSVTAPFIIQACGSSIQPMVVLGIISFVSIFHIIFLKETFGQPLKQQIKELEGLENTEPQSQNKIIQQLSEQSEEQVQSSEEQQQQTSEKTEIQSSDKTQTQSQEARSRTYTQNDFFDD